jgi:hypothetical protein
MTGPRRNPHRIEVFMPAEDVMNDEMPGYGYDELPSNLKMPDRGSGHATALAYNDIPGGEGSNMQGVVLADWGNEYVVWRAGKDGSVFWGRYFPHLGGDREMALRKASRQYKDLVDEQKFSYGFGSVGSEPVDTMRRRPGGQ